MNQQIQELWQKAAEYAAAYPSGHNLSWETQVGFIEKFAQLIVKECLMIVYERQERAPADDDGYFKVALDMVSKDIEQHFGVE